MEARTPDTPADGGSALTAPAAATRPLGGPSAGRPAAEPAVGLRGITTTFPGVVANDEVTLDFYAGEVHCLLGENGAGKTTLADVLSGMRRPDAGTILVDGRPTTVAGPRDALDVGIGRVFQEPLLVPGFTVRENLSLASARRGAAGSWRIAADAGTVAGIEKAAASLGLVADLDLEVDRLPLGRRQQVEILRAVRDARRLLILDEPTALLSTGEIQRLAELLRRLTEQGLAVVFITHRLREALAMGARVSVLRRGRVAGTLGPDRLSSRPESALEATLLAMMFGPAGTATPSSRPHSPSAAATSTVTTPPAGRPALELRGVSVRARRGESGLHDVSLRVAAGEIVGVAGLDGNGQRELAEAIAGQRHLSAGDVLLGGESVAGLDVAARRARGLGYVSPDRVGEGSVGELSVALNAVLDRIGEPPFWRRGMIDRSRIARFAGEIVDSFGIDLVSVEQPCRTLSGGNLQKLVLARELASQPAAIVYGEPTHGLDARTTGAVRRRIRDQAVGGAATLVISTDLEELLELADRIVVLRGGRLLGPVANQAGAEAQIALLMSGEPAAATVS